MMSTDNPTPALDSRLWERIEGILRSYALNGLTRAEQEARVGVLDRMGAFSASERTLLSSAALL